MKSKALRLSKGCSQVDEEFRAPQALQLGQARNASIGSSRDSSNSGSNEGSSPSFMTPMVCGAAARTVAVFAVAPLELARTRQQVGGSFSSSTLVCKFV